MSKKARNTSITVTVTINNPRNSVVRAMLERSYGSGKHGKSEGAKRRKANADLRGGKWD